MMPQAMLQPRAPISMRRTSARPDSATLSEPVKVSTMMSPKSISEMRSYGSRNRLVGSAAAVMGVQDWTAGNGFRAVSDARRQQVERHREDRIDREQQHTDEPRRPAAVRDEAARE